MQLVDVWSTPPKLDSFTQADGNGASVAKAEFLKALVRYAPVSQVLLYVPLTVPIETIRQSGEWQRFLGDFVPGRIELVQLPQLLEATKKRRLIVYSHGANNYLFEQLRSLPQCQPFPIFSILHSLDYGQLFRDYLWLLRTIAEFDRILVSSEIGCSVVHNIAAAMQEGGHLKLDSIVRSIPLGIDPNDFPVRESTDARMHIGIHQDSLVFLYFGRMTVAEKADLRPLLLALRRLRMAKINCEVIIAGHDDREKYSPELKAIASDLGIEEYIRVETNVTRERKRLLFEASDVFVALADNIQETFGISILEAMASRLPVICSDWNGYRELVLHQSTGFRVRTSLFSEAFDGVSTIAADLPSIARRYSFSKACSIDPAALYKYMLVLAQNPDLRHRYGDAGRRRVMDHFSWPSILRTHEQEWHEAISERDSVVHSFRPAVPTVPWLQLFGCYASNLCDENTYLYLQDSSICTFEDLMTLLTSSFADQTRTGYQPIIELFKKRRRSICQVVEVLGECSRPLILDLVKVGLLVVHEDST